MGCNLAVHSRITGYSRRNRNCLPEIATGAKRPRNDNSDSLAPPNHCCNTCNCHRRSGSAATDAIGVHHFDGTLCQLQATAASARWPPRNDQSESPAFSALKPRSCLLSGGTMKHNLHANSGRDHEGPFPADGLHLHPCRGAHHALFLFANGIPTMHKIGLGKFLFARPGRPNQDLLRAFFPMYTSPHPSSARGAAAPHRDPAGPCCAPSCIWAHASAR